MAVDSMSVSIDKVIRWGMARPRLVAAVHAVVDLLPPLKEAIQRRVTKAVASPIYKLEIGGGNPTLDADRDGRKSGLGSYMQPKSGKRSVNEILDLIRNELNVSKEG